MGPEIDYILYFMSDQIRARIIIFLVVSLLVGVWNDGFYSNLPKNYMRVRWIGSVRACARQHNSVSVIYRCVCMFGCKRCAERLLPIAIHVLISTNTNALSSHTLMLLA